MDAFETSSILLNQWLSCWKWKGRHAGSSRRHVAEAQIYCVYRAQGYSPQLPIFVSQKLIVEGWNRSSLERVVCIVSVYYLYA